MGARPYSPFLGRFLTVDPVAGGSANDYDYDYTNGDPINETDIDGRWTWKSVFKTAATALSVVSSIAGSIPLCGVCSAVGLITGVASAGFTAATGDWKGAGMALVGTAAGVAFGGIGRLGKFTGKLGKVYNNAAKRVGGMDGAAARIATQARLKMVRINGLWRKRNPERTWGIGGIGGRLCGRTGSILGLAGWRLLNRP